MRGEKKKERGKRKRYEWKRWKKYERRESDMRGERERKEYHIPVVNGTHVPKHKQSHVPMSKWQNQLWTKTKQFLYIQGNDDFQQKSREIRTDRQTNPQTWSQTQGTQATLKQKMGDLLGIVRGVHGRRSGSTLLEVQMIGDRDSLIPRSGSPTTTQC